MTLPCSKQNSFSYCSTSALWNISTVYIIQKYICKDLLYFLSCFTSHKGVNFSSVREDYYSSLISKQLVFFCSVGKDNSEPGNFRCHRLFFACSHCMCLNSSSVWEQDCGHQCKNSSPRFLKAQNKIFTQTLIWSVRQDRGGADLSSSWAALSILC